MKKCAFLTMDNLEDFESYDNLLVEPFAERGWQVEFVSWRHTGIDWDNYEAVIIRSPWDYQKDPEKFLSVLEDIDHSSARLENNLELVRRNIHKIYLRDLEDRGVNIVPTLWRNFFRSDTFEKLFDVLETDEIIIKPVISANADDTFRLTGDTGLATLRKLETTFSNRAYMVQPFMQYIIDEGEFSLFFFGNTYSHTVLKTPAEKDFRVQEEHGGKLRKTEPDPVLLNQAQEVIQTIRPEPLYARVDYVRTGTDSFALMELELIEPSLYFNMDPDSPERFARVFDEWMS